MRPPLATVAVFTMVPVWNDLWWPLVLAPSGGKQTVILGMQQYIGQYIIFLFVITICIQTIS